MDALFELALINLTTPMILFFALGLLAGAVKSDLAFPEAISKGLALYLMLAIGFKGGVELAASGLTTTVVLTMIAAIIISFLLPFVAYALLRFMTRLDSVNSAAISAHYGSISVVTFVAATGFLTQNNIPYEGFMVAIMALMETPAIIAGLLLARLGMAGAKSSKTPLVSKKLAHEIFLGGSIVLLMGSFVIGWITGSEGMEIMAPAISVPFKAVLSVFLLDMGLLAGRRLGDFGAVGPKLILFGVIMPPIGALFGLAAGYFLGLSVGGIMIFAVLSASASYIVVPAAMRLSLPKANPAIYVTLSLAVTFPFNLIVGIPLYFAAAEFLVSL